MGKTKYQWIALVCYFLGVISNLLGWMTHLWFFILMPLFLWGISICCVVFKPVGRR